MTSEQSDAGTTSGPAQGQRAPVPPAPAHDEPVTAEFSPIRPDALPTPYRAESDPLAPDPLSPELEAALAAITAGTPLATSLPPYEAEPLPEVKPYQPDLSIPDLKAEPAAAFWRRFLETTPTVKLHLDMPRTGEPTLRKFSAKLRSVGLDDAWTSLTGGDPDRRGAAVAAAAAAATARLSGPGVIVVGVQQPEGRTVAIALGVYPTTTMAALVDEAAAELIRARRLDDLPAGLRDETGSPLLQVVVLPWAGTPHGATLEADLVLGVVPDALQVAASSDVFRQESLRAIATVSVVITKAAAKSPHVPLGDLDLGRGGADRPAVPTPDAAADLPAPDESLLPEPELPEPALPEPVPAEPASIAPLFTPEPGVDLPAPTTEEPAAQDFPPVEAEPAAPSDAVLDALAAAVPVLPVPTPPIPELTIPELPVEPPNDVPPPPVDPDPVVAAEPVLPEPAVVEPIAAEPVVAEPTVAEPAVEEPVMVEPVVPEPVEVEPAAAEAVPAEPPVAEPVMAPVVAAPVLPEPVAEPVVAEPAVEEPVMAEPAMAEPVVPEPVAAAEPAPAVAEPSGPELPYAPPWHVIAIHAGKPPSPWTNLAQHLGENVAIDVVSATVPRGNRPATIADLAAACHTQLTRLVPRGRFVIAGYGAGAVVAYELATQMLVSGLTVELVVSVNGPTPAFLKPPEVDTKAIVPIRQPTAVGTAAVAARQASRWLKKRAVQTRTQLEPWRAWAQDALVQKASRPAVAEDEDPTVVAARNVYLRESRFPVPALPLLVIRTPALYPPGSADLGWSELTTGTVRVADVEGTPWNSARAALEEPAVGNVATALTEAFSQL